MNDDPNLPPFTQYPTCVKCGHTRSPELKPNFKHCGSLARPGRGPEDACPLGDGIHEHHHVTCVWCEAVSAMNLADGEPPLTAAELRVVRELVKLANQGQS